MPNGGELGSNGALALATAPKSLAQSSTTPKQLRGQIANARGVSAEHQVRTHYEAAGYELQAERWRGAAGEIDLIFLSSECDTTETFVFVEVKAAKDHARAAATLRPRQVQRIRSAAEEYVAKTAGHLLCDMRVDVALVDEMGCIDVLENALL